MRSSAQPLGFTYIDLSSVTIAIIHQVHSPSTEAVKSDMVAGNCSTVVHQSP